MTDRGGAAGWRRALTPNVLRLGLVSFFADVSSEMLYPLMPLFLTATLGAPASVVGIVEGLAEATASILKGVSGRIADRAGRRLELVFAGYSLSALSRPLIALAQAWPLVLAARVLDRTGKGLRSAPRDAILADSADPALRGAAFGWHRAMDTLGAVVGPLLALGLLALAGGDLRRVIALTAVPGLIGALLVLGVRDPRRIGGVDPDPTRPAPAGRRLGIAPSGPYGPTPGAEGPSQQAGSARGAAPPSASDRAPSDPAGTATVAGLPRAFRLYLAAWLPFVLVNSSDVFLILRARQLGFSTTAVVLLYTLYNCAYAAASVPLGSLSDRLGRRSVLTLGMLVFAGVYAGFALAGRPWLLVPLFAVYGLYIAATDGVGKAYAVDLVPLRLRATSVGILGALAGVATLVASAVAGVLWDSVGPWAPFALGAAGALLSAALFATLPGSDGAPGETSIGRSTS